MLPPLGLLTRHITKQTSVRALRRRLGFEFPGHGYQESVEKEVLVSDVATFETKNGNTGYRLRSSDGDEYTTFREAIGEAALRMKGRRSRVVYHEEQRGQYTNVYLDEIQPLENDGGDGEDTDPEEAGWRTAVDAAPWLVGDSDQADEVPPDQMFEKLKPFKDRVAEDIREDSS